MNIIENEAFQRLIKNYVAARTSWEFYCFIERINDDLSVSRQIRQIDQGSFLYHARTLSFKDTFIQLYKVLKKNHSTRDNIHKIAELAKILDPSKSVAIEKAMLEISTYQPTIKAMCDLRDKVYAHLDSDYKNYLISRSSLEELNHCYFLIERAIITMTDEEYVKRVLNEIPGREDYKKEFGE